MRLHTYYVSLAGDSGSTDEDTVQAVSALDADLIGRVSGIFLAEDPAAFQTVTDGLLAEPATAFDLGLHLAVRKDAEPAYDTLFQKLS